MEYSLLIRLAVAVIIGLVVGLERGWATRAEHRGMRTAGVRTFALVGLLGGGLTALPEPMNFFAVTAGLLVVGSLVIASYLVTVPRTEDFGLTTEFALPTTYALGALAVSGFPLHAVAAAVALALLLGFKPELHRAIQALERRELISTLQLLLIAAVFVPLLPNQQMGPWQSINPRTIGLLVLLIAGVSYVGYFAVKALGARLGLTLTAILGGLSSSTAVAVAYARRARSHADHSQLLGIGIAIAAATMVPRLCMEIALVNASLLAGLWPTLLVLGVVPLLSAAFIAFRRKAPEPAAAVQLGNPLQLRTAVVFGILLSVFFIAVEGMQIWMGNRGIYLLSALAGIADVDAVALSLAESANHGLAERTAQRAIAIAVFVNTGVKAAIAGLIGGKAMFFWASGTLTLALAAAMAVAALTLR